MFAASAIAAGSPNGGPAGNLSLDDSFGHLATNSGCDDVHVDQGFVDKVESVGTKSSRLGVGAKSSKMRRVNHRRSDGADLDTVVSSHRMVVTNRSSQDCDHIDDPRVSERLPTVSDLADAAQKLLDYHETRLCMVFLKELAGSDIGTVPLGASSSGLSFFVSSFISKRARETGSENEALHVLAKRFDQIVPQGGDVKFGKPGSANVIHESPKKKGKGAKCMGKAKSMRMVRSDFVDDDDDDPSSSSPAKVAPNIVDFSSREVAVDSSRRTSQVRRHSLSGGPNSLPIGGKLNISGELKTPKSDASWRLFKALGGIGNTGASGGSAQQERRKSSVEFQDEESIEAKPSSSSTRSWNPLQLLRGSFSGGSNRVIATNVENNPVLPSDQQESSGSYVYEHTEGGSCSSQASVPATAVAEPAPRKSIGERGERGVPKLPGGLPGTQEGQNFSSFGTGDDDDRDTNRRRSKPRKQPSAGNIQSSTSTSFKSGKSNHMVVDGSTLVSNSQSKKVSQTSRVSVSFVEQSQGELVRHSLSADVRSTEPEDAQVGLAEKQHSIKYGILDKENDNVHVGTLLDQSKSDSDDKLLPPSSRDFDDAANEDKPQKDVTVDSKKKRTSALAGDFSAMESYHDDGDSIVDASSSKFKRASTLTGDLPAIESDHDDHDDEMRPDCSGVSQNGSSAKPQLQMHVAAAPSTTSMLSFGPQDAMGPTEEEEEQDEDDEEEEEEQEDDEEEQSSEFSIPSSLWSDDSDEEQNNLYSVKEVEGKKSKKAASQALQSAPSMPSDAGPEASNPKKPEAKGNCAFEDLQEGDVQRLATKTGPWIVHPSSSRRMGWDLTTLVIIMFESVTIPLHLAFDVTMPDLWFWLTTAFFSSDIVLNFCTGYYADGILILRQEKIVQHYILGYFLIDVAATVPWQIIIDGGALVSFARFARLIRILRLLKLAKVTHLFARLEDVIDSYTFAIGLSLARTLVMFMLLCHWSACIWGFLGSPAKMAHASQDLPPIDIQECDNGGPCEAGITGSPWLRRFGLLEASVQDQYLIALGFATGIITGGEVGVNAGYNVERGFVVAMMIVSFFVCSTIISQIVVVIHKMTQSSSDFRDRLMMIKEFMITRKVPYALQVKVKRYLEYQHKNRKSNVHDNLEFIGHLSPWLRLELSDHMHRNVITAHPFFAKLPVRLLKRVCGASKTVLYAPDDVVVIKGHKASCMCFIIRGKLHVLKANKDSNIEVFLTSPSWIGDMCLFKDMVRQKTVMSVTHSELLIVSRDVINQLIAEFPKMRQYYNMYQAKVLKGDLISAGLLCEFCKLPGHFVSDCPKWQALTKRKSDPKTGVRRASELMQAGGRRLSNLVRQGSLLVPQRTGFVSNLSTMHEKPESASKTRSNVGRDGHKRGGVDLTKSADSVAEEDG